MPPAPRRSRALLTAARILLTLTVFGYSLGTLKADFNKTHAANPAWTGHARFHVVWQISVIFRHRRDRALSDLGRRVGASLSCGDVERCDLRRLLHHRVRAPTVSRLAVRSERLPAVQAALRAHALALRRQCHGLHRSFGAVACGNRCLARSLSRVWNPHDQSKVARRSAQLSLARQERSALLRPPLAAAPVRL